MRFSAIGVLVTVVTIIIIVVIITALFDQMLTPLTSNFPAQKSFSYRLRTFQPSKEYTVSKKIIFQSLKLNFSDICVLPCSFSNFSPVTVSLVHLAQSRITRKQSLRDALVYLSLGTCL